MHQLKTGNGDCPGAHTEKVSLAKVPPSESSGRKEGEIWQYRGRLGPMSWCPGGFCLQEGHWEFPPTSAKPLSPQTCWDKLLASSALGRGMSWECRGLTGHTGLAPKHGTTTLERCPTGCPASCQGQELPPLPGTKLKVPVEEVTLWDLPGLPLQSA